MSGYDKFLLEEKLIELGWSFHEDKAIPPNYLLEKAKRMSFSLYDAIELDELIKSGTDRLKLTQ